MPNCDCCPGFDLSMGLVTDFDAFYTWQYQSFSNTAFRVDRLKTSGVQDEFFAYPSTRSNVTDTEILPNLDLLEYRRSAFAPSSGIDIYKYDWIGGTLGYRQTPTWSWTKSDDGTLVYQWSGKKISIDSEKNVYVTFSTEPDGANPNDGKYISHVVKIDKDGNQVWDATWSTSEIFDGSAGLIRVGARMTDVEVLPNGTVHATGKMVAETTLGDRGTGPFEWRLDKDGNTLWTIEEPVLTPGSGTATYGDEEYLSSGKNVVADQSNIVHILYDNASGDSITLVGYDTDGNQSYSYTNSQKAEGIQIEERSGYLFYRNSTAMYRYSTASTYWDTQDWSNAAGASSNGDFNLDKDSNLFMSTGGGFPISTTVKGIDVDGNNLFSYSVGAIGIISPVMVWPGRNFL